MAKPQKPPSSRTNLASCIVATIFLIFVAIVILIIFFTLFKPKEPEITVNSIQLPSFSVSNGTVNFTFSEYVSVTNPNRAVFSHFDSTLQLLYSGTQVGFLFVPAGKIGAGRTQYMSASFSVRSFPMSAPEPRALEFVGPTVTDGVNGFGNGPTLEIESRLELAGRVRVLHVFTHRLEAKSDCRVTVSVSDGSVLGFHC